MDLNKKFLERCKLHKTLIDLMKIAYKPTLKKFIKNESKSDEDNMVAEEYDKLLFYMKKIRNIFIAFKQSLVEITDKKEVKMPKTPEGWSLFYSMNKIDEKVKEYLSQVVAYNNFSWLRSISEVASNTEYNFLGHIDTVDLEKHLNEFDPLFKKYIEIVLKSSSDHI